MLSGLNHILQHALIRLLRPLVRMMIRQNVPFGAVVDLLRHVYVTVAREELTLPGKKLSDSRVSVVTGIPRKDIKKFAEIPKLTDKEIAGSHNRASRVLMAWIYNSDYHTDGKPRDLPLEHSHDSEISFEMLVKKHSGGVPHRAVLDELLRIQAVRFIDDTTLRLVSYGYAPSTDDLKQISYLSQEISDFLNCIDHNISHEQKDSFLQLSARCDNLPEEAMTRLKSLSKNEGHKLLREFANQLSRYDRDENDNVFGTGRHKAVMGLYYYQEDLSDEERT